MDEVPNQIVPPAPVAETQSPPTAPVAPPKRSKKWLFFLILILIIAGGLYYLWTHRSSSSSTSTSSTGFTTELAVKTAAIDKEKAVTKTFGQAGGTMSTRAADGTLYTLTVPDDALILEAEVSMSPLIESPVTGIDKPTAGFGVFLDGGFEFIRPAFITIQPNTEMPEFGIGKAVTWGRCTIASRGYDPEICVAEKGIPFAGGVEPGKVVIMAINEKDYKLVLPAPTVPIGEVNVYNAEIFREGAYFGTKINKAQAEKLAEKTFSDDFDYLNATEALMHLLTLGGDISPYKDRIAKFKNGESSYHRDTLEGAILAKAVGDTKTYDARIEDFKAMIDRNITTARGSFYQMARYAAFLKQLQVKRSGRAASIFSSAKAESDLGVWPEPLEDFDESARNDTGGSSWGQDLLNALNQRYRDILGSKIFSCSEKAWAAESLELLGTLDAADREAINTILGKCADQCKTLEECERQADIATKNGNPDAATAAIYRMTAYLEKATDCTSQTKKTLENYGQNFCQ